MDRQTDRYTDTQTDRYNVGSIDGSKDMPMAGYAS